MSFTIIPGDRVKIKHCKEYSVQGGVITPASEDHYTSDAHYVYRAEQVIYEDDDMFCTYMETLNRRSIFIYFNSKTCSIPDAVASFIALQEF